MSSSWFEKNGLILWLDTQSLFEVMDPKIPQKMRHLYDTWTYFFGSLDFQVLICSVCFTRAVSMCPQDAENKDGNHPSNSSPSSTVCYKLLYVGYPHNYGNPISPLYPHETIINHDSPEYQPISMAYNSKAMMMAVETNGHHRHQPIALRVTKAISTFWSVAMAHLIHVEPQI